MSDNRGPLEIAYDTEILDLMREVRRRCKAHGIRMVAGFDLDRRPETGEPLLASHNTVPAADLGNASARLREAVESFAARDNVTAVAYVLHAS